MSEIPSHWWMPKFPTRDSILEEIDTKMNDNINHPAHYADGWSNGSEVIDITENLNFNRGNAVKYIARAGKKNPDTELEDLRKAAWYINRELERIETTTRSALERAHSGYQTISGVTSYGCICGHPSKDRYEWDDHRASLGLKRIYEEQADGEARA